MNIVGVSAHLLLLLSSNDITWIDFTMSSLSRPLTRNALKNAAAQSKSTHVNKLKGPVEVSATVSETSTVPISIAVENASSVGVRSEQQMGGLVGSVPASQLKLDLHHSRITSYVLFVIHLCYDTLFTLRGLVKSNRIPILAKSTRSIDPLGPLYFNHYSVHYNRDFCQGEQLWTMFCRYPHGEAFRRCCWEIFLALGKSAYSMQWYINTYSWYVLMIISYQVDFLLDKLKR